MRRQKKSKNLLFIPIVVTALCCRHYVLIRGLCNGYEAGIGVTSGKKKYAL